MVEEILVKGTLTDEMIKAGDELLDRLDSIDLEVTTSFWWYIPESNTWRLLIASPKVKTIGPKKIYRKIENVLSKMPAKRLALRDIGVVQNDDPLIFSLRRGIKVSTGMSGVSVTATGIDDRFIDDAFIYRST